MTTYDADKAVADNEPHGAETPAGGEGPTTEKQPSQRAYHHPAAGWGAAKSVTHVLLREHALIDGPRAIFKMNHESGGSTARAARGPTTPRVSSSTSVRTASSTSPGK